MGATILRIKVKVNARVSSLVRVEGGTWLAHIKARPVDGNANEDLIALLAEHFQCRKSAVSIKSGASARIQLVQIDPI